MYVAAQCACGLCWSLVFRCALCLRLVFAFCLHLRGQRALVLDMSSQRHKRRFEENQTQAQEVVLRGTLGTVNEEVSLRQIMPVSSRKLTYCRYSVLPLYYLFGLEIRSQNSLLERDLEQLKHYSFAVCSHVSQGSSTSMAIGTKKWVGKNNNLTLFVWNEQFQVG